MNNVRLCFFSRKNTINSNIVRLFFRSKYHHVGILLEDNNYYEAYFNRGVVKNTFVNEKGCCIVKVPLTNIQYYNFSLFIDNQTGKPYDLSNVCRMLFGFKLKRRTDKYFCSSLVYEAFSNVGISLMCRKLTPDHLFLATNLKLY